MLYIPNLKLSENQPVTLIVKYRNDFENIPKALYLSAVNLGYGFAVVNTGYENVKNLLSQPDIIYAEADKTLTFQRIDASGPAFYCKEDNTDLDGDGVIVGIIDSPIDISHQIFKDTKISTIGDSGNESFSVVNPHGTAVAGIIPQIAPKAEIIGYGIRERGTDFAKASDIMIATAEIVRQANGKPLVINISYGTNDGSHIGDSLFEEYLDNVAQNERIAIVAAAGNMGNSAKHFSGIPDMTQPIQAEIAVISANFNCSIWYNFSDDFIIQLIAPNNETYTLNSNRNGSFYFHGSISVFWGEPTPYSLNNQLYLSFKGAVAGLWTINFYPQKLSTDGRVNIWLTDSNQTVFSSPVIDTTITLPAFAQRVITVGAYNSATGATAVFSGSGFSANAQIKPDLAAPGVNIYTAGLNNTYTTVSGTSFAAPYVSGVCALLMQWGIVRGNDPILYGQRLKAFLQKGSTRQANRIYPNKRFGFGTLCLYSTLELLRR